MSLRVSALVERLRSSLFFIPMIAVFFATVLGFVSLAVDRNIDSFMADFPIGFTSTVESARTLLGVIAGATISFAGVAFSVSLLIIQLASSQYSPRVVHTLFRDPFNKRVMALVVGTFTYCVVVLRSVRSALEPGGDSVIPNLSVAVAVVLGIATILSIVALINHSAHSMDISEILHRIRRDATEQIRAEWTPADPNSEPRSLPETNASGSSTVIRVDRSGWVQQIDIEALLVCVPDGATLTVETYLRSTRHDARPPDTQRCASTSSSRSHRLSSPSMPRHSQNARSSCGAKPASLPTDAAQPLSSQWTSTWSGPPTRRSSSHDTAG